MTINATCRQLGAKRLAALKRIRSREDFAKLWPKPKNAFDFAWGDCWKAVVEYGVADYAAELGFYVDYLGFILNASWDDHAMLMSPDGAYAFTIYKDAAAKGKTGTLLNMQFMLGNIKAVSRRLKRNKVQVVQDLRHEWGKESPMKTFRFLTPNKVTVTLWGFDK